MISKIKTLSNSVALFLYSVPKQDSQLHDTDKLSDYNLDELEFVTKKGKKVTRPLHLPLVIDTEFTTYDEPLSQTGRTGISTQIKGISDEAPSLLFFHPQHAIELNKARGSLGLSEYPQIKSEAHFVDYLNHCGVEAEIVSIDEQVCNKLPSCYLTLFAHFATAELCMVFSGGMLDEVKYFIEHEYIKSRRRLIIANPIKNKKPGQRDIDSIDFRHHALSINGKLFKIRLRLIDTCAMHGIASYADIAANVGVELLHKEDLAGMDKGKMMEIAKKEPLKFSDYALGDLQVYDILEAYSSKWGVVHSILGLLTHFQEPKATIGGTVKNLFMSALAAKLGIYDSVNPETGKVKKWNKQFDERVVKKYLMFTPSEMRQNFKSSKALLTKVVGGRCRNNRPQDIFVGRQLRNSKDINLVYDIDISGCYGEGQRNQRFFLGDPVIFGINNGRYTQYPSLRQVLKELGVKIELLCKKNREDWINEENWGELISGSWMFVISTLEKKLQYSQDFFGSWVTKNGCKVDILAKIIKDNIASDTESNDAGNLIDFDEEAGTLKIFENEIHNGFLTHDGLQWLFAVTSARQRNELLDKVCVLSGALYPRTDEIKPFSNETALDELDAVYEGWEGKVTVEILKGKHGLTVLNRDESCHKWVGFNLGDLIINDLLIERKKAQITHGKKSPLDQLFKLCVNTLYGDLVSKFFTTSNPIVGNNITARARALAWYMEKGFNGWQSITDGCGFELNKVLTGKGVSINGEMTITSREELLKSRNIKVKPLTGEEISCEWIEGKPKIFSGEKEITTKDIDLIAFNHLRENFPVVDILHSETTEIKIKEDLSVSYIPRIGQFSFEGKDIYHSASFHGSANYIFQNPNGIVIKMRGYEIKKRHESWMINGENVSEEEIEDFVKSERYGLKNNPGKDFMTQLLEGKLNEIERQLPAIKTGILKVGTYQQRKQFCESTGLLPGDNFKMAMLFQEFSITQFTFKTYEQFMGWTKSIEKDKDNNNQSIETFFLNQDGTLRFKEMTDWVADAIRNNIVNPYTELDKYRHRARSSKKKKENNGNSTVKNTINIYHPNQVDYLRIKEKLRDK